MKFEVWRSWKFTKFPLILQLVQTRSIDLLVSLLDLIIPGSFLFLEIHFYMMKLQSFRWLFETFLATYDYKNPKTTFTHQDIAMGKALGELHMDYMYGI
ncbi:hypothetical protein V2J09_010922 [Rumex salicifolius]